MDIVLPQTCNFTSFFIEINDKNNKRLNNDISSTLPNLGKTQLIIEEDKESVFYYYKSQHPLSKIIKLENSEFQLYLIGEFYEDFNINIDKSSSKDIIREVDNINGNWNMILFDKQNKKIFLKTDYWGFNHMHYSPSSDGSFCISSSIWPFAFSEIDFSINKKWIRDKITILRGSEDDTFLNNIKIVQPETIIQYDINKKKVIKNLYLYKKKSINKNNFLDITKKHYKYVIDKCGNDIGLTMTAGKDSRVILNSMLKNGISPTLISGFISSLNEKDIKISNKISKHKKLNFQKINLSKNQDIDLIQEISIMLTNGSTWGNWTYLLNNTLNQNNDINYWGFSGDKISVLYETSNIEEAILKSFNKCYSYSFKSSFFDKMFNFDSDCYSDYYNSFQNLRTLNNHEILFYHYKQNRNFRRIHDFSSGSKIGVPQIYLYHDLNIINYYLNLNQNDLFNQKHHIKLGYLNDKEFKKMPLNNYPRADMTYFMDRYFSKILLKIMNKRKKENKIEFTSKSSFQKKIYAKIKYLDSIQLIQDFFDFDRLYFYISKGYLVKKDLETIISTINSILILLDIVKNKKFRNF